MLLTNLIVTQTFFLCFKFIFYISTLIYFAARNLCDILLLLLLLLLNNNGFCKIIFSMDLNLRQHIDRICQVMRAPPCPVEEAVSTYAPNAETEERV